MQCEIFVLKWFANFNATSPGKELYHGGYARETLLGMLDCGDVASMQCEIFVLKWFANFNATSPGKELYHGGYARETLLGMFYCGYVASMHANQFPQTNLF